MANKLLATLALATSCLAPVAHAGLLDDLLKNPNIQSLINRPDLNTLVAACRDAAYRAANTAQCQNMENAVVLAKLPNEMRVLMGNPQSANSLREICTAVQSTAQANSYLCAQLRSAESAVGAPAAVPAPPPATPAGGSFEIR